MSESLESATSVAAWAGLALDGQQQELLTAYAHWLADEAIVAGGLGPREGGRIWDRHVADSLSFAAGWPHGPPPEILDVGTGVGLPGIPLAILWPECTITLLDRGGRRIRLLHRVVGMLELPNVLVTQADIFAVADEWEGLTFRGSVKAPEAVGLASKLLDATGTAVLAVSRRPETPDRASDLMALATAMGLEAELCRVPAEVLDGGSWLLIMRR